MSRLIGWFSLFVFELRLLISWNSDFMILDLFLMLNIRTHLLKIILKNGIVFLSVFYYYCVFAYAPFIYYGINNTFKNFFYLLQCLKIILFSFEEIDYIPLKNLNLFRHLCLSSRVSLFIVKFFLLYLFWTFLVEVWILFFLLFFRLFSPLLLHLFFLFFHRLYLDKFSFNFYSSLISATNLLSPHLLDHLQMDWNHFPCFHPTNLINLTIDLILILFPTYSTLGYFFINLNLNYFFL